MRRKMQENETNQPFHALILTNITGFTNRKHLR